MAAMDGQRNVTYTAGISILGDGAVPERYQMADTTDNNHPNDAGPAVHAEYDGGYSAGDGADPINKKAALRGRQKVHPSRAADAQELLESAPIQMLRP